MTTPAKRETPTNLRALATQRAEGLERHNDPLSDWVRQIPEETQHGEFVPHDEFKRRMEAWLVEKYGPRPLDADLERVGHGE